MERELCLQIPQDHLAGVAKAIQAKKAKRIPLRALYFDTATRALARAGIALRVRREGDQWVQTLKAPGTDTLSRIELNHPRDTNTLDLSLYEDSVMKDFFAALDEPLQLRFETDVQRHVLMLGQESTQIEIAFDEGFIRANGWSLPIRELEFELVSGDMDALFDLAKKWLQDFDLTIEVRSKAHRGDALADLEPAPEEDTPAPARLFNARRASRVQGPTHATLKAAYLLCANECMQQIMTNAALLATADPETLDPETRARYVHQLRVGIRRLRSCWKLFKGISPKINPKDKKGIKRYFKALGQARNTDVIKHRIEPALVKAGMPLGEPESAHKAHAPRAIRASDANHIAFQSALLTLLQQLIKLSDEQQAATENTGKQRDKKTKGKATPASIDAKKLRKKLHQRLENWWDKTLAQGRNFSELSINERHDIRKQIKRLRYCLEFYAGLFQTTETDPFIEALEEIQQILGDLNDYYVAEEHYRLQTDRAESAWFALGWLRAMQTAQVEKAQAFFDERNA